MTDVLMPALAEGLDEGTVARWLKRDGDRVGAGEEIAEIETDKVTVACTAAGDGVLQIVVAEGRTVAVGEVIARLGAAAAPASAPEEREPPVAETGSADSSAPASLPTRASRRATPLARLIATRHAIDLEAVAGSGPRGLITRADLQPDVERLAAPRTRGRTKELTRLQRLVAERMVAAKSTVPEFQVQTEAVVDRLLELHRGAKELPGPGPAPSLNDFVVKAAALALRDHPLANASYEDGRLVLHEEINVGIAVAAEGSLVVPVVRNADRRTLADLAGETRRLAELVRTSAVTPADLAGGTFTVSSLGMFGMTAITPIVNAPQAAILGVGAVRETLALLEGAVVQRHLLTLTLTCDHRVLYGADAARFLTQVRELLERPLALAFS